MSEKSIDSVLNRYLRDAHAMEMNVHQMLVALIATTKDPGTTALLEQHQSQIEAQIQRLGSGYRNAARTHQR
ncbi:MAG: DUF892 family protein [Actinobacteria bacterium]|nr:DUF892 family protein [Actinomycetota bacterium]